MKTNVEIRRTTREALSNGWFGRMFISGAVLYSVVFFLTLIIALAFRDMEVQTWGDFLQVKMQHLRNGMDYTVPSRAVALQMSGATLFDQFFRYLFGAIVMFGIARVSLKAVRGDEQGWFSSLFGGFSRPFGVMWLLVRMNIQVFLWSLLFVIPGIVAIYRYRQAWYLKSDHPDWGAGKCLAVSGEKMRGLKWQAFCLDLFYVVQAVLIGAFAGALIGWFGGASRAVGVEVGLVVLAIVLVVVAFAMIWLIRITCAMFVARAEFYRAIPWEEEMTVDEAQKGEI